MFLTRSSPPVGDECGNFALRVSREPGTHIIEVYGELDLDTSPLMASRIVEGEGTTSQRILVDLSGVDFMASAGMNVLVEADARSRSNGHRLALLRAPDYVHGIIERVGLAKRLPFID